ncbi:MAG: cell division protein ZapB [Thermodesulfovibrio sp.]|nr:cell division protein ZapB [Thermodesulfovibrio sp.]
MIEEKIVAALEKIRALKLQNEELRKRVNSLEETLRQKDSEIENLLKERQIIKKHIETLLTELDLQLE